MPHVCARAFAISHSANTGVSGVRVIFAGFWHRRRFADVVHFLITTIAMSTGFPPGPESALNEVLREAGRVFM